MHKHIHGTTDWCLANDTFISSYCEAAGSLIWDRSLTQLPLWKHLPKDLQVIDVGAYIGDTTRFFQNLGYAVTAFEPQPDAFECLVHNCPGANHFPFAVGNGERVVLQQVSGGNLGGRSVYPSIDGQPTVRLDDFNFSSLDLLKIDVEGSETRVLQGAKRVIEKFLPIILIEINEPGLQRQGSNSAEVLSLLEGYKSHEIYRYGRHQWDLLMWHPYSQWNRFFSGLFYSRRSFATLARSWTRFFYFST